MLIESVKKLQINRNNMIFFSLRSNSLRKHMTKQVLILQQRNLKSVVKLLKSSKLILVQVLLPILQLLYHLRLITTVIHHTLSFNKHSTSAESLDFLPQTKHPVKESMIREVLNLETATKLKLMKNLVSLEENLAVQTVQNVMQDLSCAVVLLRQKVKQRRQIRLRNQV